MKIIYSSLCLIFLGACTLTAQAQKQAIESTLQTTVYQLNTSDASHPCISTAQYDVIEQRCAANIKRLGLEYLSAQRTSAVPLSWPLKAANGLNDGSYYIISAYVDQDAASGSFQDWNCGTNTYDSHRGTDICTFPYPFYKMDNDQVEVISAADGFIIDKNDGEFDKNCTHSSAQANYVVVQHADGTFANYFHMKKNSITSKAIGQTVTAGEYLGVVGSSGDANGPHLHFEVRTSNTASAYKDPFAGGCNTLNTTSWWATQKPYTEPSILKAQVGTLDPVLTSCPTTETPHDDDCVVAGTQGKFYIFIRNETPGDHADLQILGPTGLEVTSWIYNSTSSHLASICGWTMTLPSTPGNYTFQAKYNGITTTKNFQVSATPCAANTTAVTTVNELHQLQVYPNPSNDKVTIAGEGLANGSYHITLRNVLGQTMLTDEINVENNTIQKTLSVSQLPNAMYFLSVENEGSVTVRKIEKN